MNVTGKRTVSLGRMELDLLGLEVGLHVLYLNPKNPKLAEVVIKTLETISGGKFSFLLLFPPSPPFSLKTSD